MQKIKDISEDAWKDMMERPPSMWTRSTFRTDSHCDLQVNNIYEAFNIVILEYIDKLIITLLESLKHYITFQHTSHCNIASTLARSYAIPQLEITWSRKLTSRNQNSHFDNLTYNFFYFNTCSTVRRCPTWSSYD